MRPFLFACCLLLAGCAADPSRLGITGPGVQEPPSFTPKSELGQDTPPGVSTMGTFYGPTNGGPQTGPSGFWGYN